MWHFCPKCGKRLLPPRSTIAGWQWEYDCPTPKCNLTIAVTAGDNGHQPTIEVKQQQVRP